MNVMSAFLSNLSGLKTALLAAYLLVAVMLVSYNWLYLYHSLHVSTRHIGLNSPQFIRRIIKACIGLSLVTAVFIMLLLILGSY